VLTKPYYGVLVRRMAKRTKEAKVVITFQMPRNVRDEIREKAKTEGRSLSAQMRRYIEQALAQSAN